MTPDLMYLADIFDAVAKACRNQTKMKAIILAAAHGGIRKLQADLGVHVDGTVGPITTKALEHIDVSVLIDRVLEISHTPKPVPMPVPTPRPPTPTPEPSHPIPTPTSTIPPPQSSPIDDTSSPYAAEYSKYFDSMVIDESRLTEIQSIASRILQNASRYQTVANDLGTGYYWPLIGIIHNLESGMNFHSHLYNGDPLTGRTVHIPVGHPIDGEPPFTWEFAAADALRYERWDKWHDWTIDGIAYMLEKYNGFGYRRHNIPSPYLWAGSNIYTKGFYVNDGIFDPNVVSKQIGGMTMLKYFIKSQPGSLLLLADNSLEASSKAR